MTPRSLLLRFVMTYLTVVVVAGFLAFIGAMFHAGMVVAIAGGLLALAIFLGPGTYLRMKRRRHGEH